MCTTESSNWCSSSNTIVSVFLHPKNINIYCCRTYCTSIYTFIIYTFIIFTWLASTRSIRFCCMNFSSVLIPQCLSPPLPRSISPSCRLSVAGNQTVYTGFSFQAKFHVGCIFLFSFRGRFTLGKTQVRSCSDPTPSVGHVMETLNDVKVMRSERERERERETKICAKLPGQRRLVALGYCLHESQGRVGLSID